MTNDTWRQLLEDMRELINREVLQRKYCLDKELPNLVPQKHPVITCNVNGIVFQEKALFNTAGLGYSTSRQPELFFSKLITSPEPISADFETSKNVRVKINSLEAVAAFILLHEAGHIRHGHFRPDRDPETPEETKLADEFAEEHLSMVLDSYNEIHGQSPE